MNKRGKTSGAEREFQETIETVGISAIEIVDRPKPPFDFDNRETSIWVSIVNSMPSDWFNTASLPLLRQFVHHTVAAENLSQLIAEVSSNSEELNIKTYITLLTAQKEQSGVMAQLATKLRLTNQSLINQRGNSAVETKSKPWD